MIRFDDVHKAYNGIRVLNGLTLHLSAGSCTAVVGPSGAGKSTVLRCLNGLDLPDRGSVRVGDLTVGDDPALLLQLRRRVGMVFQHLHLFPHMSIRDNCTLAPHLLGRAPEDTQREVVTLSERLGIAEHLDKFPAALSGGQQQRAALVRALCAGPQVLAADEPTSALDPAAALVVAALLREKAAAGMSVIAVTHDMAFARHFADSVVYLEGGVIAETASPDRFFDDPQSAGAKVFLGRA